MIHGRRRFGLVPRLVLVVALAAGCGTPAGGSGSSGPGSSSSPEGSVAVVATATAATPAASPTAKPRPKPVLTTPPPVTFLPPAPTTPLDAGTAARLQAVLDDLVAGGAPDAIGAVITADGTWSGAAGVDGPDGRKALPIDMFNIASLTKPILAALVLQLAEEGKIDLDAPLASYLGDLPVDANGATVRQALVMRAGLQDTSSDIAAEPRKDCAKPWSRTDVLRSIPAPSRPAGESYAYSNPTYKLLGYAVEHVTGESLDATFEERMFAPLGLDRILLQGASRPTPKPWALPLPGNTGSLDLANFGIGDTLPCLSISTFSFATSAVASDAPTIARWGWGLFSGALLEEASLFTMTTVDAGGHGMGIDRLSDFGPTLAFGEHGGQVGYSTFMFILPERQVVSVLFVNRDGFEVQGGARSLIRALTP